MKEVFLVCWFSKNIFLANYSLFTVLSGMFHFGKNDVNCSCLVKYHLNLRFWYPSRSLLLSCFGKKKHFWPILVFLRYFQVCFILARMMLIVFALLNIIWICVFFYTHHERSLLVSCCGNIMLFLGQFWSLYGTFICFFCKNYVNCICIVKYHLNLRFLIPIMKEVCEFPDLAKNCLIWPILVTFRYLTAIFW